MPETSTRYNVPLFQPLAALAAGIIAGSVSGFPGLCIAVPSAAFVILALLRRYHLSLLSLILSAGATLSVATGRNALAPSLENTDATYSGIIVERTDKERTTATIVAIDSVADNNGEMHGIGTLRAAVYFFDSHLWISPGRRVRFTSRLSTPLHDPMLPDDPDLTGYYRYKEISATGVVFPDQAYATGSDSSWRIRLDNMRHGISDRLHHSGVSPDCASFLEAILLGDDSRLDRELRDDFKLAGLSHIVALSGTHVAIIALLVYIALFPLYLLGYRKTAMTLSVVLLFGYAFLTGLSASVLRSVIMASVVILATLADRTHNALNSLCFAAIVILCLKPSEIFSPGMQMSFMAVASILLLSEALNPVSRRRRWLYNTVGAATVTVAAVAGTWIIACHYFHYTPLWFLPVNLPMVIFLPVEIAGGAILIFSEALGLHVPGLTTLLDAVYSGITWIASAAASHPGSAIRDMYINPWCIPVYFLGLYALAEALRSRGLHLFALSASLFIATGAIDLLPTADAVRHNQLYITRDNSWTDVVIYDDSNVRFTTTAWRESSDETLSRFTSTHEQFLSHRKADTPELLVNDTDRRARRRQILLLGHDMIFAIAGAASDTLDFAPLSRSRYTLVTRSSQHMSAGELRQHYNPDTLLLACEIYPSVHDRLVAELQQAGMPYISLRDHKGVFKIDLKGVKQKD